MANKVPWTAIIGLGAIAGISYVAYKYFIEGGNGEQCLDGSTYCDVDLNEYTCINGEYVQTGTCEQPSSYAFSWGPVYKDGVQLFGQTTSAFDQGEDCNKCPGEWGLCHFYPVTPWYHFQATLLDQSGLPLPNYLVHLDIEQTDTVLSLCPPDSAGGCGINNTTYCALDLHTNADGILEFVMAQMKRPSAATVTCNLKMVADNTLAGVPNLQKAILVIVSRDGYLSGPDTYESYCLYRKVGCP